MLLQDAQDRIVSTLASIMGTLVLPVSKVFATHIIDPAFEAGLRQYDWFVDTLAHFKAGTKTTPQERAMLALELYVRCQGFYLGEFYFHQTDAVPTLVVTKSKPKEWKHADRPFTLLSFFPEIHSVEHGRIFQVSYFKKNPFPHSFKITLALMSQAIDRLLAHEALDDKL